MVEADPLEMLHTGRHARFMIEPDEDVDAVSGAQSRHRRAADVLDPDREAGEGVTHAQVLEAFAESLEQPRDAFARTWRSLEAVGNLSSASVLFVLGDTLAEAAAAPGAFGLLLAMGPGFCSELVLLRW